MKRITVQTYLLAFSIVIFSACNKTRATSDESSAEVYPETEFGWKLGSQAYTFKAYTFFEAIDKIDSCGLQYVEGFPGQTIGGGIEGKMDFNMEEATRNRILQKLNEKGVKMHGFGVVQAKSEKEWRKLFEFAQAMGVETITSEPDEKDIPLLSSLSDEFKINVAIHNHPNPSHYWNPDVVLNAIKGQSKRIGACADIGHWVRSGLDPVESLKKLEGHILHLHMKDLNEKGKKEAHDVHWGEGVSNVAGVIEELKRQNFSGMISAEYEYNWNNNASDVAASVSYFRNTVKQ
jgi:sugar phosphate isomerase/epimerase